MASNLIGYEVFALCFSDWGHDICNLFLSPLHHLALHASYISSPWPELTNHRKTKRQLLWHLCSNNTDDIFAIFQLSILYYTEPIIASFQFDCPWISFEHFMSLLDSVMQKCEWKKQTRSNQQCHIRAFQRVCLCLFFDLFQFSFGSTAEWTIQQEQASLPFHGHECQNVLYVQLTCAHRYLLATGISFVGPKD